jgi:hypothetical protein
MNAVGLAPRMKPGRVTLQVVECLVAQAESASSWGK